MKITGKNLNRDSTAHGPVRRPIARCRSADLNHGSHALQCESGELHANDGATGTIEVRGRPNLLADERFPAPPRQERSRRSRDAVLAAALALFARNGFEATTIDDIARHAGVAVGGFYLHFRSKRQVLQVLVDSLLSELDARLGTLDDPARLPEQLVTMTFDSPYAGVYRAWREAVLRDPSIAALDAEIEAWMSARIAAAFRAATLRPAARAAVDLRSIAWMLNVLWQQLLEDARPDRNAVTEKAAALIRFTLFEDPAPP